MDMNVNINRQQVHHLVDIADQVGINLVYHILMKYIPEDVATADEREAIRLGKEDIRRGDFVSFDEVDWD